jgi:hypothetical protein
MSCSFSSLPKNFFLFTIRLLFLLFLPVVLQAQSSQTVNVYKAYQKSLPTYKKTTTETFRLDHDSLIRLMREEETWLRNEHVYMRQSETSGDCKYEKHIYYSPKDTTSMIIKIVPCLMQEEEYTEKHGKDSTSLLDKEGELKELTLYATIDGMPTKIVSIPGSNEKTVTTEESGKKQENLISKDSLQYSTIFYGKEDRYDSVVLHDKSNRLLLKKSYYYNSHGEVITELETHQEEDYRRIYKTIYSYTYDEKNNWIEKKLRQTTISNRSMTPGKNQNSDIIWISKRTIEY